MNVAADMTKGVIDRFRTMSISKTAVIIGHGGAGVVRNTISTITIISTAFVLGFRPHGFISSGFVPVDSMAGGIKWFAEIQPMTPIIDSFRALTLDLPLGDNLWMALAWSVGIAVAAFSFSIQIYKRRIS